MYIYFIQIIWIFHKIISQNIRYSNSYFYIVLNTVIKIEQKKLFIKLKFYYYYYVFMYYVFII